MNREMAYALIREAVRQLRAGFPELSELPEAMVADTWLMDVGFDAQSLAAFEADVEQRLDGRKLDLQRLTDTPAFFSLTVGALADHIVQRMSAPCANPVLVYVDDEEQNLYIFNRRFGRDFTLKTFTDPKQALTYIENTPEVRLVVTDEVMPGLRGNELCDLVHKVKPFTKFVLITANPENDDRLMYKTLRGGRFHDFIQKPVQFDAKHDEYCAMFRSLMGS